MEILVSTKRSCSSFLGITHGVLLRHLQNSSLPVHAAERWQPKWSVCCVPEWERLSLNTLWQEEEIVKVLPAQSSDSSRRYKWQGRDGNNSNSFLPASSFAPSFPAERHSSHSSFKFFVIYLLSFLLSTLHLALCATVSGTEGEKKRRQSKMPRPEGRNISGCQEKYVILWFTAYLYCSWLALGN